jgi:glycosyltransferase involved in cell wall biosynthesis
MGLYKTVRTCDILFVFPAYHTGGAEKANLDIVSCFRDRKTVVLFTDKSNDDLFLEQFQENAVCFDIHISISHRIMRQLFTGALQNILKKKTFFSSVLGCNTPYFYQILEGVENPQLQKADLLHAFSFPDGGIEDYSIDYAKTLDLRIVSNLRTKLDYEKQYKDFGIPAVLAEKIAVIENGIVIPPDYTLKAAAGNLNILYCGRGTYEKRPQIYIDVAKRYGLLATYQMIGSLNNLLENIRDASIIYNEGRSSTQDLEKAYAQAHILVLTSSREGLPLVIMEAMSYGAVCICTDVGAISEHIQDGYNGFIVPGTLPEAEIADQIAAIISRLAGNREYLQETSKHAYEYAKEKFNFEYMKKEYRKLLIKES